MAGSVKANAAGGLAFRRDRQHDDAEPQHRQSHELEHKCVHDEIPQQRRELCRGLVESLLIIAVTVRPSGRPDFLKRCRARPLRKNKSCCETTFSNFEEVIVVEVGGRDEVADRDVAGDSANKLPRVGVKP